jgi:hypothetical protein
MGPSVGRGASCGASAGVAGTAARPALAAANGGEGSGLAAETVSSEYRLRVGRAVIALTCSSPAYAASVRAYFGAAPVEAEPHVRLRLNVVDHEADRPIPQSLFTPKTSEGERFSIAGGVVCGRVHGPDEIELWVDCVLTKGGATRVFEQLLYQAFYTARGAADEQAFLVHSSAAVHRGAGFLFVGASGAGKSTAVRLSQGDLILNDEVNLVRFTEGGVTLEGTPFNGYFREKLPGSADLRAVLLLRHGPEHRVADLARSRAVAAVAPQIVPPVGLAEPLTPAVRAEMLTLAERLTRSVPVRILEFRPDAGFWPVLEAAFPSRQGASPC